LGNGYNDWDWNDDWRNNYNWTNNVEYIMTNDGLKPTHPVKEEENNEDNQEDQDVPATPENSPDTTRYHYEPSNDSNGKTTKQTQLSTPKNLKNAVKITDITSAFFERFSL
jgi:hypothetical protein